MAGSFAQKIVQQRGGAIRFLCAEEKGRKCWFYLKLNPELLPLYEKALKSGDMNIRDYGEILHSGWGDYPSEEDITHMLDMHQYTTPPAPK
ncbi:MAG: hypothetical protein MK052_02610 [Alphaproteobacteria bacterium]|nr:hypothetical protein [Alphaproteobacteria bacterium]